MFLHELVQPLSFAAKDDGCGARIFDIAVELVAALVQAVNPKVLLLEFFKSVGDIADTNNGEMLERTGRGFGHRFGESRGPALGNEDCCRAGCVRGANDCAEVMRIFDAVEDDEELRVLQNLVEIAIALGCAERDHALVSGVVRNAIEHLAGFEAQWYGAFSAQVYNFLEPCSPSPACD